VVVGRLCQPVAGASVLSFWNAARSSVAHGHVCCRWSLPRRPGEREPGGDVKQPVAQPLGLGLGQLAVEDERLGPDDQVVRERDDLEPHLVERERLERELGQAGVLVVTDPVLDVRVLAVAALQDGDVLVGLVGEDRLDAVAVVVGERQLRAGVRTLTPHDQPGALGPGGQINHVGDLTDLAVLTLAAVLVEREDPCILGDREDRGANLLGQLVADENRICASRQ
jgi:hypothetical protein